MDTQKKVIELIVAERKHQLNLWGKTEHDDFVWNAILNEEVGEVAHAILNTSDPNLKSEIVRVAAVAFAWIEQIVEYEQAESEAD